MSDNGTGAFPAWRGALDQRYRAIAAQLGTTTDGDRDRLKREIIALFREVDGALADLAGFKESIRTLVEQYKQLPGGGGAGPAAPVHADHIGASTYVEKGWSLIALGDAPGAIQALERALQLSPGHVEAESLLGWAQMLAEQFDEAMGTFSRVLMKEPGNALARTNVGYICLRKGIHGEAIEHLSRAIRLDNDRKATLYAHYYLGLVYLQREMFEDAQVFFRKALELGPNLVEARLDLGRAAWFAGDRPLAMRTWTEGATGNRLNPWAKRCQELLDLAASGAEIPRGLYSS